RARTDRRRALWRRVARRALSRADVSPAGARRVDARRRRGGRAPPGGHRGTPVTDTARDKEQLFERARRALANDCPAEPRPYRHQRSFFVPGRLEVLGKHTDYAGGRSLLCTVERGICLVAAPRDDDRIRIVDAADGSTVACRIDPNLPSPVGDWSNYPLTVVRRVARNFPAARRGVDMALVSDLPAAAGMSSSSALMIATFLALADANALDQTDAYRREIRNAEELAGYLATVENGQDFGTLTGERGVGTFGGSEDHTAMLCCRAGQLSEYSFCPVHYERSVPFSDRHVFVIGVSGVAAEKTGAARDRYNRASLATQRILALWRQATGRDDRSLAAAVGSDAGASDRIRDILRHSADREFTPTLLLNRFDQFVEESDVLVPSVVGP